MRTMLLVLAMVLFCGVCNAAAEDYLIDFSLATESKLLSKQVYRGELENDDFVARTGMTLSWKNLGVSFFANTDLTDENDARGKFSRADVAFTVGDTFLENNVNILRKLDLTLGFEHRWYPEYELDDRTEIFVQTDMQFVYGIESTVKALVDLDTGSPYVGLDISRQFATGDLKVGNQDFSTHIQPNLGLGWGGSGYNEQYHGGENSGFIEWHAGLELMIKSTKRPIEFGPTVEYVSLMDEDIRAASDDDEHVIFGLKMTMRF